MGQQRFATEWTLFNSTRVNLKLTTTFVAAASSSSDATETHRGRSAGLPNCRGFIGAAAEVFFRPIRNRSFWIPAKLEQKINAAAETSMSGWNNGVPQDSVLNGTSLIDLVNSFRWHKCNQASPITLATNFTGFGTFAKNSKNRTRSYKNVFSLNYSYTTI